MKQTTFQHPELRDANDNIIQQGTYGKESPLVNSTNDGVLDYINNNLEALYDNLNGSRIYVASKAKLPATGDLSAMYIAEDTGKWYVWNGTTYIESDDARKSADEAIAARDAAKASQTAAKTSEQNAKTSETNAEASKSAAATSASAAATSASAAANSAKAAANSAREQQADWNVTDTTSKAFIKNKPILNNAGAHNSIYRGKYLGDHVTDEQYDAIDAGTFEGLFIGDYWVINGVNWRIAAFDYWLHCGDAECKTHHVVIVPDTNLATCQMNNSNVTTGAYIGSNYYTGANSNTGKATANTAINNAFGSSHILTHRELLANAVTNGYESAGTWYDSKFELMTEEMVYGRTIFHNIVNGTNVPYSYTIGKSQLPLFALEPSRITNRASWWLRDVVSAANFAIVTAYGNAHYLNASNSLGVRPAFAIKK